MADSANSRSKKKLSKNQRKRLRKVNKVTTNQSPKESETSLDISNKIKDLNDLDEEYKVDFPEPGNPKPKLKIKSKSLDDDDDVKIQEVDESGDDDKQQCEAIVSEADSDWEETTNLRVPQNPVALSTIAISIDEEPLHRVGSFSPEEELSLRNFLEGINLVNAPDCQLGASTLDSIKQEKARKRDALCKYFTPLAQNPRFLDIISEEGSDLSDRESSSLTRHLKQGTPELENINENSKKSSPRVARRNKLRRLQLDRNEQKAVLVCTKILDTPSIIEHIHSCTTENTAPETVFLESSSDNASSENSSDAGASTPESEVQIEQETENILRREISENESASVPVDIMQDGEARLISDTDNISQKEIKTQAPKETDKILGIKKSENETGLVSVSGMKDVEAKIIAKADYINQKDKMIEISVTYETKNNESVIKENFTSNENILADLVVVPDSISSSKENKNNVSNTPENTCAETSAGKHENAAVQTQYVELTPPPTPEYSPKKKLSTDSNVDLDLEACMKEIIVDTAQEITSVLCKLTHGCEKTFTVNQVTIPSPEKPMFQSVSSHSPSVSSSSSRETSPSTVRFNPMTSSIADVASILPDLELAKESALLKQPYSLRHICLKFLLTSPSGTNILQKFSDISQNFDKLTDAGNQMKEKLESDASLNLMNSLDTNNSNLISEATERLKKIMSSEKWAGLPFYNNPNLLLYLSPAQKAHLEKSEMMKNGPEVLFDLHSKFSERMGEKEQKERRIEITTFEKEVVDKTSNVTYSMNSSKTLPRNFKETSFNPRLEVSNLDDWLCMARKGEQLGETIASKEKKSGVKPEVELPRRKRRISLPDELYQRQLQMIVQKEKEIEQELENLLEEKRKLYVEIRNNELAEENIYESRGNPAKQRPKSFPQSPNETLRQQMYEEYMNEVAEREERKHHKMIKITSTPTNKNAETEKPQFEAVHLPGLEDEFMKKVHERHGPLEKVEEETIQQEDANEETSNSSHVLLIDGKSVKEATDLPKHLKEFVELTADRSCDIQSNCINGECEIC